MVHRLASYLAAKFSFTKADWSSVSPAILIATGLTFLCSCKQPAPQGDLGEYFDTRAYFQQELNYLQELSEKDTGLLHKTSSKQDERSAEDSASNSETSSLGTTSEQEEASNDWNWEKELALFTSYDLAHPSRQGKYRIDSSGTKNAREISFSSLDPSIHPSYVSVIYNLQEPVIVHIVDSNSNLLYENKKTLTYGRSGSLPTWQVEVRQKSVLQGAVEYRVEVAEKQ